MRKDKQVELVFYFVGAVFIAWLSVLVAPCIHEGLFDAIIYLNEAMNSPFSFELCQDTLKCILISESIYSFSYLAYYYNRKNYRRNEEYGSAKWANNKAVNKKYAEKEYYSNKILSQNVCIGLDGRRHRRNLNTLVIGGSGAGKTRFFGKPNLMQCNTSFVVLDPKGEQLRDVGNLLEKEGYVIKVVDLINMNRSHCYNPFRYIKDDKDVLKLITNLIRNTTPKGSQTNDPFWEKSETALLEALCLYLLHEAPEEEQNFVMVMELLRAGDVKEDDDEYVSPLDMLFNRLETRNPEHIALKYYRAYHSGSAKTLKSIQVTLAARLEKFNLESMAQLTQTDELDLPSLGEKKVALFAIIPDNDTSFNFLVSVLYTQLFQQLFYLADYKYGGSLPIHVHFVMDEFANVSLPDDFDKILSVMRSREVSVSIILQNLAQLKALFEKQWESIVGNCDEFLYLGGNEQSTHKYVSELLGKETIDTNTYGRSYGSHGSYSTNDQIAGRELLTPDEVRMLDNNYALLFIRGERPVKDFKFNLKEHFNSINTPIGNKEIKPYIHGGTENSIGTISFNLDDMEIDTKEIIDLETNELDVELLSSEEIENMYKEDTKNANSI